MSVCVRGGGGGGGERDCACVTLKLFEKCGLWLELLVNYCRETLCSLLGECLKFEVCVLDRHSHAFVV